MGKNFNEKRGGEKEKRIIEIKGKEKERRGKREEKKERKEDRRGNKEERKKDRRKNAPLGIEPVTLCMVINTITALLSQQG